MLSLGMTFCSINVFKIPMQRAGRAGAQAVGTAQSQGDTLVQSCPKSFTPHHTAPSEQPSPWGGTPGRVTGDRAQHNVPGTGGHAPPVTLPGHLSPWPSSNRGLTAQPGTKDRKEGEKADRQQCEKLSRLWLLSSAQPGGKDKGRSPAPLWEQSQL